MRRLLAILATLSLLVGVAAFTAATVSATCTEGKITVARDTNGGGGTKVFCFPNDIADLDDIDGPCWTLQSDWSDCISSVRVPNSTNDYVCLWTGDNFTGSGLRIIGPVPSNQALWYNLPSTWQDSVDSIEWGSNCLTD